jgi:hypothetical protein
MSVTSTYIEGSPEVLASVANAEIIPAGKSYLSFQLLNDQDCTIKVNGSNPIFIRANQGFSSTFEHSPIYSFKIVEAAKTYTWIGSI